MAEKVDYNSDFCAEMRDGTMAIHDESDKLMNLKLVAALTDTKTWSQAIADFYFVFRQLEISLEKFKNDPRLEMLYFCAQPDFRRTELFQNDLQYYLGSDWSSLVKPSKAATSYCGRLEELEQTKPILLIAYVHSMYLALLAGGAILRRIIKKTLGLPGEDGLALFSFGDKFVNRAKLRKQIKEAINSIPLSREEKDEILREKAQCFHMNNAIANGLSVSISSYSRFLTISTFIVLISSIIVAFGVSKLQGSI